MIKNITLSADESLIRLARHRAQEEHKSLNIIFREWIKRYVGSENRSKEYQRIMKQLSHIHSGRHFTREEMNER